jgi:uncharacterized protein YjeT (DUF2065 family)
MKTRMIKTIGLALSLTFAIVGLIFLLAPEAVLRGLNAVGRSFGMSDSPLHGAGFFSVLASSYMAVVTVLAWRMFKSPASPAHPLLLGQAKAASSLFSFGVFGFHAPYFVLLANGIVDGALAVLAFCIFRSLMLRRTAEGPA